jgi:aspartate aminotransferase
MQRIGESATLRVTRLAAELRARGVDVLSFGAGEPDFDSPGAAVESACEALRQGFTRYTPHAGTPDLRAALAERTNRRWGSSYSPSQVLVTVGAKAALFELALALFDEGDRVLLHSPCWVSFPEQIRFAGAEPVALETEAADAFAIRAAPFVAALDERVRAVLLNFPCNPTGGIVDAAELRQIVAAGAACGALVIADETYERFYYAGAAHSSAAALAAEFPETVVVVGSFSKTYAMTGWRVGYLLGPERVVDAVSRIQSHATSNVTSFAMAGALAALREADEDVERMLVEYRARRELMVDGLNAIGGIECPPPMGAFYAFPRVAQHYRSDRQGSVAFAEAMLEEARVALVPGVAFGNDEHVRLSFACSREQIEDGLERLRRALA